MKQGAFLIPIAAVALLASPADAEVVDSSAAGLSVSRNDLTALAPLVDAVIAEQLSGLKTAAENEQRVASEAATE